MNKLISIVVPVYNVKEYLDNCVHSIVDQSYPYLEIILIDDGSTDGSEIICDAWSKKDERIKVYHQLNQGVSSARNQGIRVANGEFIGFVDADDYIEKDMYQKMVQYMENKEIDLVISNYYVKREDKITSTSWNHVIPERMSSSDFLFFMSKKYYRGFLCNKLYRLGKIKEKNLLLDESISVCEDLLFNAEYAKVINQAWYLDTPLYYYVVRKNSAINRTFHEKAFSELEAYLKIIHGLSKEESKIIESYKEAFVEECFNIQAKMNQSKVDKNFLDKLMDYLKMYYSDVQHSSNVSKFKKIYFFFNKNLPHLTVFLKNMYHRWKGIR